MLLSIIILVILHLFTPYWWWIIVVPLLYGFFRGRSALHSLLTGLGSAGVVWLAAALYHFLGDAAILAPRVATMLGLGAPEWLVGITALIAMTAGATGGITGFFLRDLFRKAPI